MFTENVKRRGRGRPPGQTPQGAAAKERLYGTAIRLIADRGYEATTLRDIASAADVSVGLLYRYFPSKQAIVIALYDELSAQYARRTSDLPPGTWRERFMFALTASLEVLEPHELALRALTPVLVSDPDEGIFAASTAFSRLRVQRVFEQAVIGANDSPKQPLSEALGRLLYSSTWRCFSGGCWTRAATSARRRRWLRSPGSCCLPRPWPCGCRPFGDSWSRSMS
jgi:AcrR family transcriptional regulator